MGINIEKIKHEKSMQELLEFSILNIDKPSGPTSFDVSDFVRKKLELRKTSHFGTLDPKVTGVLPIALNRACKLTGYFLGHDKEYIGIMRIHEERGVEEIQEIINKKFLGKIRQTPPVKSRVKRVEREREVKKFEILEKDAKNSQANPKKSEIFGNSSKAEVFGATKSKTQDFVGGKDFLFIAEVQGGTYIRKLIDDLGKEIGGAHMLELRRIRAGVFSELDKEFVNLYDFENAVEEYKKGDENKLREILIPAEEVLKKNFPIVEVKKSEIKKLWTGKPILKQDLIGKPNIKNGEIICVFSENNFIGMYKVINDGDLIAKPEFVLQPM
ncbi:MAG: hypothetical protein WC584_04760 [Candidatus Pacearchaeota archaeon]